MNYRFMLCHSTLHSCLSKDTYFNVLSWVIFSPFISEKLCTSRCVHKAILLSLTRLYFVDHAVLRASTYYYWVLLLFFVDRSWAFHGPPKYVWIPLSSIWSFTEAIFSVMALITFCFSNLDYFFKFSTVLCMPEELAA